jgi:hypothetical protein
LLAAFLLQAILLLLLRTSRERKKETKEPDRRRHNPSYAFPLSTMQVKLLNPLHFLPQEIKFSRNFPCLVALPVERTLSLRTAWFFPVCDLKSIAKCFVVLRIHFDSFSTLSWKFLPASKSFGQYRSFRLWNIERREKK